MMKSPSDREAEGTRIVAGLGGRVISWFASPPESSGGGWSAVVTYEMPDGEAQFALLSLVQSTGAFSSIRTQRIIPNDEFQQALRRAADIKGFNAPVTS